ncbi:MAG: 50S ribosomal protein L19 [Planctomycetes bacterium]|nr:50S ribosomal protein L19 [Planctomycetota bacterium]
MIPRAIQETEAPFLRKKVPEFRVGDTVDVHVRIEEIKAKGEKKQRIQIFSGDVIARKHGGVRETFTVRRIVQGEGVERIFPLHSPVIDKIDVRKRGKVRRAKLFYLRELTGRAGKLKERRGARTGAETPVAAPEAVPAAPEGSPEGATPPTKGAPKTEKVAT